MIHSRLRGLEKDKLRNWLVCWLLFWKNNPTAHSTTGFARNEAVKQYSHMEVWLDTFNKATYNRKYPPLKVGSQVRVYQKPKSCLKRYASVWSDNYIQYNWSRMELTYLMIMKRGVCIVVTNCSVSMQVKARTIEFLFK